MCENIIMQPPLFCTNDICYFKASFSLLYLCVCLCHMCASVLSVLKMASNPLELKLTSGGKSPNMGARKLGPLPEEQMLLTTDPFLQPQHVLT